MKPQIVFGALWFIAVTVPMTLLMASHTVALNEPTPQKLAPLGHWHRYHVLASGCGCSASVAKHLLGRGPQPNSTVLWIGEKTNLAEQLTSAGFDVEILSEAAAAQKYAVQGAPAFLITREDGSVAYSGGYSPRRITATNTPLDEEIFSNVHKQKVARYPIFGCAVGARLKDAIDPAKLKYN